jgi:hypothetical protein
VAALAVALVFGLTTVASGRPFAVLIDPDEPPAALGACLALAALLVAGVDAAAIWRFSPRAMAAGWILLLVAAAWGWGWTGRRAGPRGRAVVLALVALAAAVPLLLLPVPFDTDAQGFGMLALAVRDGGTLNTLAPWRPAIAYLYSPGALVIFASLSAILRVSMPAAMMGVCHATMVLIVWTAWTFGEELGDRSRDGRDRWAWAAGVSAAASGGLWTALMDSHYTAILGLLFVVACVTALFRYLRTGRPADAAAAAITMAATLVVQADSAMVLAFGLASLAAAGWIRQPRAVRRRWALVLAIVPLCAGLAVTPWLAREWPLIRAGVRSPYVASLSHWRQLIVYQGVVWPALAVIGAVIWARSRTWAIVMAVWFAAVAESSLGGWIEGALPEAARSLLRFNYPYSLAWHGPIVPSIALGAGALVWGLERTGRPVPAPGWRSVAAGAALAALVVGFNGPLLAATRSRVALQGAFSSANDVRAMVWLRDHTPRSARVLNYPGDYDGRRDWEAHWAPVVSERDCVYFRMQPFFTERPRMVRTAGRGLASAVAEQESLLAFWRDPADRSNERLLRAHAIDYVLVPEWMADPSSLSRSWRWQPPATLAGAASTPDRAPYLEVAYRAGGARVYRLRDAGGSTH